MSLEMESEHGKINALLKIKLSVGALNASQSPLISL